MYGVFSAVAGSGCERHWHDDQSLMNFKGCGEKRL